MPELDRNNFAQTQLQQLLADDWETRVREDPLFATRCGDQRFNDQLPHLGEQDVARRLQQVRDFLARLAEIDSSLLSPQDHLNYQLFEIELRNRIADLEFGTPYLELSKVMGPQIYLPELADISPLDSRQDFNNYLARLRAFPNLIEELISLIRSGVKKGFLPARVTLNGLDESLKSLMETDPVHSHFFAPFNHLPADLSQTEAEALLQAGYKVIQEAVNPAFAALLRFVQEEYLPAARPGIAAGELPGGLAYYAHCIRKFTTLDLTPQQIHRIGLDEVRRIQAEMEEVIRQVGFNGSLREFLRFLLTDERFYVDTPDELMKEVAMIMKRIDGELPRLFKVLPRTPYGLRQIPTHIAPGSTSAYYFPPSGDGTSAGFYYVNTYDLRSRPLYEYEALSLHEAVPGHHLQIALQIEMEAVPNFRRYFEATAFIEGWALYAERLGLEVGFYQDPYHNFGRLTFEMWRAARLVVDTGMHALGWSRAQAILFMKENTALSHLNIINEIDRYIAWPGQALAYKIGELKIRELRALAERELEARFDRREFHRVILEQGGIPLQLLEEYVSGWIASQVNKDN
jgi:uncharacterized protein (DUF885 family)